MSDEREDDMKGLTEVAVKIGPILRPADTCILVSAEGRIQMLVPGGEQASAEAHPRAAALILITDALGSGGPDIADAVISLALRAKGRTREDFNAFMDEDDTDQHTIQ